MTMNPLRPAGVVALCLLVVLAASAFALSDRVAGGVSPHAVESPRAADEEIVSAVREFWGAAREGDEERARLYMTKTPRYYLRGCKNKILDELDKIDKKAKENEAPANRQPDVPGLNSLNTIESMLELLNSMRRDIRTEQSVLEKVVVERWSGDEAVVRVSYSGKKFTFRGDTFLLHKEEGRWKIFMFIAPNSIFYCENYAGGESSVGGSESSAAREGVQAASALAQRGEVAGGTPRPKEEEIASSVREFWGAAREGDEAKLADYMARIPPMFKERCAKIAELEKEDEEELKSRRPGDLPLVSVPVIDLNDEFTVLKRRVESIRKNQSVVKLLTLERRAGDEAIVRVWAGVGDSPADSAYFFLHKEGGRWKIILEDLQYKYQFTYCANYATEKQ